MHHLLVTGQVCTVPVAQLNDGRGTTAFPSPPFLKPISLSPFLSLSSFPVPPSLVLCSPTAVRWSPSLTRRSGEHCEFLQGSGIEPWPQKHFGRFFGKEMCLASTILVLFVGTNWSFWTKMNGSSDYNMCGSRVYMAQA